MRCRLAHTGVHPLNGPESTNSVAQARGDIWAKGVKHMATVYHIVRVLVVEDFEPFRRFIRLTLAQNPDLRIVGEVSDGLEAVRTTEAPQPDSILLDLGLATLDGLAAARKSAPSLRSPS